MIPKTSPPSLTVAISESVGRFGSTAAVDAGLVASCSVRCPAGVHSFVYGGHLLPEASVGPPLQVSDVVGEGVGRDGGRAPLSAAGVGRDGRRARGCWVTATPPPARTRRWHVTDRRHGL